MYSAKSILGISTTMNLIDRLKMVSKRRIGAKREVMGGLPSYPKYVALRELQGAIEEELDNRYRLVYGKNNL